MATTVHYIEVTSTDGKRYGIQAVAIDPGDGGQDGYAPHVSELDADGDVKRTIVDSDDTDEAYDDPRSCLIHAMVHVL